VSNEVKAKKTKKYYRNLYRKYKAKSVAATEKLRKIEGQLAVTEGKLTAALTRLGRIEHDSAMNVRKEMDLQYMEVNGNKPILWINTSDPKLANAATFANIRDRLRMLAPGIEMIILTYGDLRLWEMDAKDLEKIGLARIPGHAGGTIGKDVPQLGGS
jgi:hypothetical protein